MQRITDTLGRQRPPHCKHGSNPAAAEALLMAVNGNPSLAGRKTLVLALSLLLAHMTTRLPAQTTAHLYANHTSCNCRCPPSGLPCGCPSATPKSMAGCRSISANTRADAPEAWISEATTPPRVPAELPTYKAYLRPQHWGCRVQRKGRACWDGRPGSLPGMMPGRAKYTSSVRIFPLAMSHAWHGRHAQSVVSYFMVSRPFHQNSTQRHEGGQGVQSMHGYGAAS